MESSIGILTERQAQVLRMAALGMNQEEISRALGISQPRVSAALKKAKEKIKKAEVTVKFSQEIRYIEKIRASGYRGEAIIP